MHRRRLRWGLLSGFATLAASVGIAVAAAGDLDTSFGKAGRTTVDFGGAEDLFGATVQPDGKIIAVGGTTNVVNVGDESAFAIARLLPDGSLDTGFGDAGTGLQIFGFGPDSEAVGAVVQPDGKIIVAGEGGGAGQVFTFIRLNPNGAIDRSFGTNGVTGVDIGPNADGMGGVALAPDGSIVGVGATEDPRPNDSSDIAVVRLTPDGMPDTSFTGDGKTTINFGADDFASGATVLPDGSIALAGSDLQDFKIVQLTPAGELDPSFGTQGVATLDFDPASSFEVAGSILRQPDGRLVVGGATVALAPPPAFTLTRSDFAVGRLLANGQPDPSFDGDGKQTVTFATRGELGRSVALQDDGSILVSGAGGEGENGLDVARLTPAGALDPSFASEGKSTIYFGVDSSGGFVLPQGNNKAVVAGARDLSGDADEDDFVFARIDVSPPPAPPGEQPPGGDPPTGITCKGQTATVTGTDSTEKLGGTSGNDVIAALGGNDKVSGGGGDDLICGGDGKDKLAGGAGADTLLGEDGNDKLSGGGGPDKLKGGAGADVLNGGGGKNVVQGGPGVDVENP